MQWWTQQGSSPGRGDIYSFSFPLNLNWIQPICSRVLHISRFCCICASFRPPWCNKKARDSRKSARGDWKTHLMVRHNSCQWLIFNRNVYRSTSWRNQIPTSTIKVTLQCVRARKPEWGHSHGGLWPRSIQTARDGSLSLPTSESPSIWHFVKLLLSFLKAMNRPQQTVLGQVRSVQQAPVICSQLPWSHLLTVTM